MVHRDGAGRSHRAAALSALIGSFACGGGGGNAETCADGSAAPCAVIDPCAEVHEAVAGDGCCPGGHDRRDDADCSNECGDGRVEAVEECDPPLEGLCGADCRHLPRAFRASAAELLDPHLFTPGWCLDITSVANGMIGQSIEEDDGADQDSDSYLDLSIVEQFRPLQPAAASTEWQLVFPDCTSAADCTATASSQRHPGRAVNGASAPCVEAPASNYGPLPVPAPPCYAAGPLQRIELLLGGAVVPLEEVRIGATYQGDPVTGLTQGLMRGFVSETEARAARFAATIPVVGGRSLAELLRGGDNDCSGDDRDIGPDGVTKGWYVHVGYTSAPTSLAQ